MDEKMPLRKASNPTPDFRRQHSPPITHELARQKREGLWLVFSQPSPVFFHQPAHRQGPSSTFSQLLLLQILSPIVKKICKIEK
jgi:hypothetical protein